jgi:hypothetical protein
MKRSTMIVSAAVVAAVVVAGGVTTAVLASGARPTAQAETGLVAKSASPSPTASRSASATAAGGCSHPTTTVSTASALSKALGSARSGTVVALQNGTYRGRFTLKADGATVCGGTGAVIDGGGTSSGYAFHVDGADRAVLSGFTIRNAQKGVMVDDAQGVTVSGMTVTRIGDEGIHVRDGSTGARIVGNRISDTGSHEAKYGEGIYVGTAKSNWCDVSNCQPDKSDGALIQGNTISATTAESVDIKEGTTGGTLTGNSFDGAGSKEADSWVDVKGNDWTITDNTGAHSSGDGFQTHQIVDGWGTGNRFADNTATVDGDGYGFHLAPALDNVVACDNTAPQAGKGLANVTCAGS